MHGEEGQASQRREASLWVFQRALSPWWLVSVLTLALGSLPDSSFLDLGIALGSLKRSSLPHFLHISVASLLQSLARQTLWPQRLVTQVPEKEGKEEGEAGGDASVRCGKGFHVHLSVATEVAMSVVLRRVGCNVCVSGSVLSDSLQAHG